MSSTFAVAGKLTREYLLPPVGNPRLDAPGGNLLYAVGGLSVWDKSIAMISQVNQGYPIEWINDFRERGFDTGGIHIDLEKNKADVRSFIAYGEKNERSYSNAVSFFARRGMNFPKSLLGYQPPEAAAKEIRTLDPLAPSALNTPKPYRDIRFVHICPFNYVSQSQLVNIFRGDSSNQCITLDPDPLYMKSNFSNELRLVLQGITAFLPSEDEMRALFWGESHDLWDMAQQISEFGPRIVVIKRGALGQCLYDAVGNKKYEVPAYPVRLMDPTGAGDAFSGGFLAGYQRTNDPLMAVLHGNISASLKIEGVGPFAPLDVMPGLADARLHALQEMARTV